MSNTKASNSDSNSRRPPQIPFIIANEGCERFSFYGMRNILTPFLITSLLVHLPESQRGSGAKEVFHTFVLGVYFFPLLGGWIADRLFGKYRTILWLSIVYCIGHFLLAAFESNPTGFYAGLFLIALGSGGIKPLVASFVGDQFDKSNKHLARGVFDAFYWIINFGSFFASLLMPTILKQQGAAIAFAIPGLLMLVATLVFWIGRKRYVILEPEPESPDSFLNVARNALKSRSPGGGRPGMVLAISGLLCGLLALGLIPKLGFVAAVCLALVLALGLAGCGVQRQLDQVRGMHPEEAIEGVRSVLRIGALFALVTPFWSLFDQKASTWVLQANFMAKPSWFEPAQMQALNPALVMILIPFNNLVLYPFLKQRGYEMTALRRMTIGMVFAAFSWIAAGAIQLGMDEGEPTSILWQILPYALLTFGEVLVSATGLEFAYSQAPAAMKGVIMSFWNLSVTVGNLWVLMANAAVRNETVLKNILGSGISLPAFQMFFFAGFAFLSALAFGLCARKYKVQDNYRS